MKEYNKANIPLAKTLRKNMTPRERKLWYEFLRTYPIRFQRQKAIGNYIADFYCAKAKLVVELDGGGHYTPEQAEKDEARTKELEAMQLKVLRICNLDIDRNFRGVCQYIDLAVKGSLPPSEEDDDYPSVLPKAKQPHPRRKARQTPPKDAGPPPLTRGGFDSEE